MGTNLQVLQNQWTLFFDALELSIGEILRDGPLQGSSQKPTSQPRGKDSFLGSLEFKNRRNELQPKKMGKVGEGQTAGRAIEEFLGVRD